MERALECTQSLEIHFILAGTPPTDELRVDHVQASYAVDWLGHLGTVRFQHCRPTPSRLRKPGENAIAL